MLRVALDPRTYSLVSEQDGEPTKLAFRVKDLPGVPPDLPLILGDFLTNVRAALDHLAWQLVPDTAPEKIKAPHLISFPIYHRDEDDRGNPKPARIIGVADPGVIEAVEAVQPYQSQGTDTLLHPLYRLNELCKIDKHRLLLVAVAAWDKRGVVGG